jgi:allophanate hydrolase
VPAPFDSTRPTAAVAEAYRRLADGQRAAWITIVPEAEALGRARALEAEGRRGRPLWGVPFAVKDNIDVAGMPTTAACPAFAYTAEQTAPVVQRLLDAGAVLVGKTNLDQFATGLVGTRTPYGTCHSALDPRRIAGGSSTGSAVAVAEGIVPFALGTDTAGSGRVPAACNGIVGLKPSRGLLSTDGVVPACRSWDCLSIFTRSVPEAATVLAVLTPASVEEADGPGERWRLGVPDRVTWGLSPAQQAAYDDAVGSLATWADVRTVDLTPLLAASELLYGGALVAERLTTVGPLLSQDPDALDVNVRQVVGRGRDYSAVAVFSDLHRLADLAEQLAPAWSEVDALVCPTVPDVPTLAAVEADPLGVNTRLGRWTNGVNLLDLCAVTVPAGRRPDDLPGSVTVLAPAHHDPTALTLAEQILAPTVRHTL